MLKRFPVEDRFKLIPEKYRKYAREIYQMIKEQNLKGKNPSETELINALELANKRYIYHGAISALFALQLITKAGKVGRVYLFKIIEKVENDAG